MPEKLLDKLERWGDALILLLPNVGVAMAVLVGFWLLSRFAGRATARIMRRLPTHRNLDDLTSRLVRFTTVVIGMIVALHVLHLEGAATAFVAGAGIIGLALGFAFQDLTANFIAGVVMTLRRPMQVGDLVETNGFFGTIERISLRLTFLRTPEGQEVMIPNRKIFEDAVINYTAWRSRRVDLEVGVSYRDDLDEVRGVALAAAEALGCRTDQPVELFFTGFGDHAVNLVVRYWIRFERQADYMAARSEGIAAIKRAFDEHGITIPFPIRTLELGGTSPAAPPEPARPAPNGGDRERA